MHLEGLKNPYGFQCKNNVSFGKGRLNTFVTSDNHGKLKSLPDLGEAFNHNNERYSDLVKEIFPNDLKTKDSVLNIGLFNGDWCMDPDNKGFSSYPDKPAMFFQMKFLKKLNKLIKQSINEVTGNKNYKAYFNLGNHDLDGGDDLLIKYLPKSGTTTLLSNVINLENTRAIKNLPPDKKKKFISKAILEISDDKNPALKHKVLLLGVTIPSVDFYNPNLVNNLEVIDRTGKKDAQLKENDLQNSYRHLDKVIEDFKQDNPKGGIILAAHTGTEISKMFAKNLKTPPDVILNGHDHRDEETTYERPDKKKTLIVSLASDNIKFNSVKLDFDDEGNLNGISNKSFYSKNTKAKDNNPLKKMLAKFFSEDNKELLQIKTPEKIDILTQKNIRKDNNLLANFVTDAILNSIKKRNPEVQIFGVASSAFRQDLPVNTKGVSNLELLNVLSGQPNSISKVSTGKVKGVDLLTMLLENIEDHLIDEERNTIVQWSNIQLNKTKLAEFLKKERVNGDLKQLAQTKYQDLAKFIKVKGNDNRYKAININEDYTMALPNSFLVRVKMPTAQKVYKENNFTPLNKTMSELFREYLVANDYKITLSPEFINETRIIR